jgi:hypothetical protein
MRKEEENERDTVFIPPPHTPHSSFSCTGALLRRLDLSLRRRIIQQTLAVTSKLFGCRSFFSLPALSFEAVDTQ